MEDMKCETCGTRTIRNGTAWVHDETPLDYPPHEYVSREGVILREFARVLNVNGWDSVMNEPDWKMAERAFNAIRADERARQPQDSPTEQEAREAVEQLVGAFAWNARGVPGVNAVLNAYRDAVRGEADKNTRAAITHVEGWMTRALTAEARIAELEALLVRAIEAAISLRAGMQGGQSTREAPPEVFIRESAWNAWNAWKSEMNAIVEATAPAPTAPRTCDALDAFQHGATVEVGGRCGKPLPCPDHPDTSKGEPR